MKLALTLIVLTFISFASFAQTETAPSAAQNPASEQITATPEATPAKEIKTKKHHKKAKRHHRKAKKHKNR